ncbi:hypothetical protein RvY_03050 [Ramazzottius varieornatus]|uniref:Uncharacterized protein n=1 Tax=Ramazzottius varieornatus TaxID=947166 RepID=A0A1D1ULT7_RAMVA|nr:hypothetical protein RvY_03050 [Ramazzottius varieornatus]
MLFEYRDALREMIKADHVENRVFGSVGNGMMRDQCDYRVIETLSVKRWNWTTRRTAIDGYFILKWLVSNGIMLKVIINTNKFIQLNVEQFNIHFQDSLKYDHQSLAR